MTWTAFHRRGDVLREVIATADVRGDGLLPMDVEGVPQTFVDELTLLGALQLRWHTRLAGHIEREQLDRPAEPDEAVIAAWRAARDEHPGVRAILDHYREQPLDAEMATAITKATRKEHVLLAVSAGLGAGHTAATAAAGARLEATAREGQGRPHPPRRHRGESLLERIRAVVAA